MQNELRRNGSGPAVIETNEERSYFLIEIPCREGFGDRVLIGDDFIEPLNEKELIVLKAISNRNVLNRMQVVECTTISESTVKRIIMRLTSEPLKLIEREGSRKTGGYVLTGKGKFFVQSMKD